MAQGRNANYPSRKRCDAGHHSIDTCDRNRVRYSFPLDATRNIGSRQFPMAPDGCVTGAELNDPGAVPASVECFWRGDFPFRGWQSQGDGVTGYWKYLNEMAGF